MESSYWTILHQVNQFSELQLSRPEAYSEVLHPHNNRILFQILIILSSRQVFLGHQLFYLHPLHKINHLPRLLPPNNHHKILSHSSLHPQVMCLNKWARQQRVSFKKCKRVSTKRKLQVLSMRKQSYSWLHMKVSKESLKRMGKKTTCVLSKVIWVNRNHLLNNLLIRFRLRAQP
jgi:hypothetical protein